MPKRIVLSVTNDLQTDQRLLKVSAYLKQKGWVPLLIGRSVGRPREEKFPFENHLFPEWPKRGFLFYAFYQLRLFWFLLRCKADVFVANDLDTLWPSYLAHKIKGIPLVFDAHEIFCEVLELKARPVPYKVWKTLEKFLLPKIEKAYTVNQGLAEYYAQHYGTKMTVVRNLSPFRSRVEIYPDLLKGVYGIKRILILQGSGINRGRGGEEAVQMMKYLPDFVLLLVGSGDVFEQLKQQRHALGLSSRVLFLDRMPYAEMMKYTAMADLGLSLDKNCSLNQELSLPNKVFDYIQARIPLMVSDRPLVADLVRRHEIGFVLKNLDPKEMAEMVRAELGALDQVKKWKKNLDKAAGQLNWEKESLKLDEIYAPLLER